MRLRYFFAILTAVAALASAAPKQAEAGDWFYRGYGRDPYAYRYVPRAYYPYYNSGYWRPAYEFRARRVYIAVPRYYQAWGYPKPRYVKHRHAKYCHRHGRHRHW